MEESMPLPAFDQLYQLGGLYRNRLDDELNYLLSLSEEDVDGLLKEMAKGNGNTDWDKIAKGEIAPPDWLTWKSLPLP